MGGDQAGAEGAGAHGHLVEHAVDTTVQLDGGFLTVCLDTVVLPDGQR
jgi:hypothetical protein